MRGSVSFKRHIEQWEEKKKKKTKEKNEEKNTHNTQNKTIEIGKSSSKKLKQTC